MDRVLLTGPAGSGKTERVLAAMRDLVARGPVERFVVIVPTYSRAEHLKRRLLRSGLPGMFDRGIGTFEQFAERRTGRRLSELAPYAVRDALLTEALAEAAVPTFGDAARFPGFRRATLRFFKEVKASDPGSDGGADGDGVREAAGRLVAAGEALPGARGAKLSGLGRVLAIYQRRLAATGLLDHEDLLRLLLARLREGPTETLRLVALDGFTDLTEVQERIVQNLVGAAERAIVTLLADGDGADGPFAASAQLRRNLLTGSRLAEERLKGNHRARGDIARLERLFAGALVPAAAPDGTARFLAGADPDDEADRVARTVLRFVADDGIPRSDVLVIVRNLGGETAARILDALRRHGIPARRVGSTPLTSSPSARSALRLLRLLAGCDEPDDALGALRSGDARDVDTSDADALDRRAAEWAMRGLDALAKLAAAEDLASCGAWIGRLLARRPVAAPQPPLEIAAQLLESIEPLLVFSFDGTHEAADARAAADAAALRALSQLVVEPARGLRVAGRAAVTPAELVQRIGEAAADAGFSPVDRRADVVNVVDADEARQWEARAVVVAGLRLGEWPGGAREDLFVSDRDRGGVSKSTRVRLTSRIDEAMRRERLLFYAAVTRARERLVLTTSSADTKGDPAIRSPFLEEALRLLPEPILDGAERAPGDVRPAPGETFGRDDLHRTALAALTERYQAGTSSERRASTGLALLVRLLERGEGPDAVLRLAGRWFDGSPRPLAAHGAARQWLAERRPRSASSLANFAQCAYRAFAEKGLDLAEIEAAAEDGPDAMLLGTIAHSALEIALRERQTLEAAGRTFDAVWEEEAGHFVTSLRLARDRAALRRAVLERVRADRAGPVAPGFMPREFERAFGMSGAPPLVVGGGANAVERKGQIDRVDVDGAGRAIVIDYKTARITNYSNLAQKLDEGLDLQLPIYALAAERVLGRRVVAAGYLTLRDGRERWLRLAPDAPGTSRADVTWEGDARAAALAKVEDRIVQLDRSIREGGIVALPRDPDKCGRGRCPFADVCRFEGPLP